MYAEMVPGKLMLFGEYAVIYGGSGLIVPLSEFGGALRTRVQSAAAEKSNQSLRAYLGALESLPSLENQPKAGALLRLDALRKAVEKGMWFDSTIPQGYGLGSSGALVAAIYRRYGLVGNPKPSTSAELSRLKEIFARLEAPFHGSSSGLDPLVCYLGKAVLYNGADSLEIASELQADTTEQPNDPALSIWLEDSEQARQTTPLVQLFREKCQDEQYRKVVENELRPANDGAIVNFMRLRHSTEVEKDREATHAFWKHLTAISVFQWEKLREMIPSRFHEEWQQSLEGETERWKLCGAGGGGFMLRFRMAAQVETEIEAQSETQTEKNHLSDTSKLIFRV